MTLQKISIAIVRKAGSYLVGQRPAGVALAGKYEFPGGKLEGEELSEHAAQRECWEEAGIGVTPERLLLVQRQTYAHGEVELSFWECTVHLEEEDQEPKAPFTWISAEKMRSLEFPEGNRRILDLLFHREAGEG